MVNFPDFFIRNGMVLKIFSAFLCLRHQHGKAVFRHQPPRLRFQQQRGPGGVVNEIQHTLQPTHIVISWYQILYRYHEIGRA